MKSIIKNKRGDATSFIIAMVVIIFAIAVLSLVFSDFFLELTGIMKAEPTIAANNNSLETIEMVESNVIPWLDYLFLFAFIASAIGLIISSIYIETHPALMVIFLIVIIITIVMGGILANIYTEIGETSELSAYYNQFTITKTIFSNLPLIVFVLGILIAIILYGKGRSSASGGLPM